MWLLTQYIEDGLRLDLRVGDAGVGGDAGDGPGVVSDAGRDGDEALRRVAVRWERLQASLCNMRGETVFCGFM